MTFHRHAFLGHHCLGRLALTYHVTARIHIHNRFVDCQGLRLLRQQKGISYRSSILWFGTITSLFLRVLLTPMVQAILVASVILSTAPINFNIPGGKVSGFTSWS